MSQPSLELELHLRAAGVEQWVTEWRFHPRRRWRLDLAWPERLIATEVHGGVWTSGRHTRGRGFSADREKMNSALVLGWRVLEVTPDQIRSGEALAWIEQLLAQ